MSSLNNKEMKLIFDLKFTKKMTNKRAKKADQERKAAEKKMKDELQKGRPEIARMAAGTAIRKQRAHYKLLQLENDIDQVIDQMQETSTMRQVVSDVAKVSAGMERMQKTAVDPARVQDIMTRFQSNAEDMGVTAEMVNGSMNETGAASTNVEAEDELLGKAQAELGIERSQEMPEAPSASKAKTIDEQREQDLEERLRRVRA